MQKKIFAVLLFLAATIFSFGSVVEKVRFNEYPPQMVFDLSEDAPVYSTDYDEYAVLLFLAATIFSFGSVVEKVRFNEYPPQMVFDLSEDAPVYSTDYDEYNRLLFLDIGNNSSAKDKNTRNGLPKYIEKVQRVDYGTSSGYFVTLNKNIFHKVSLRKNPNRVVVDFSKNAQNKQYTVVRVDYGTSSGYFVTLNKNIFHKVSLRKNPNRVVVDFSKNAQNKQYTVVIDPGHGGKDPGAVGIGGTKEKDIALAVGKYLRDELKKDFNVVMTL